VDQKQISGLVVIADDLTGALDATRAVAQLEADQARDCLRVLPASMARDALLELCVRSVHRSF